MKFALLIALVFIVFAVFFVRLYTSSPGFVSEEQAKIFFENKPECKGLNFLLNRKATYTDSPGRSLCIGFLK